MKNYINVQELDVAIYQKMIQNMIPGMIGMSIDVKGNLIYDLEGLIPLQKYLEQSTDDNRRLEIIQQISFILTCMKSYYMKTENVELDFASVFVEEKTGNVKMMYYPCVLQQNAQPLRNRTKELFDSILSFDTNRYETSLSHGFCQEISNYQETTLFLPEQETGEKTVLFENLQEAAQKSRARIAKRKQGVFSEQMVEPRLIRKNTGEEIIVRGNIFKIGKDGEYVDYCILDNPAISKSHADILKREGSYYIVDNHSLNATKVNGEIIIPGKMKQLEDGSMISLANEQFLFSMERA